MDIEDALWRWNAWWGGLLVKLLGIMLVFGVVNFVLYSAMSAGDPFNLPWRYMSPTSTAGFKPLATEFEVAQKHGIFEEMDRLGVDAVHRVNSQLRVHLQSGETFVIDQICPWNEDGACSPWTMFGRAYKVTAGKAPTAVGDGHWKTDTTERVEEYLTADWRRVQKEVQRAAAHKAELRELVQ